jgi:hypothetical protein
MSPRYAIAPALVLLAVGCGTKPDSTPTDLIIQGPSILVGIGKTGQLAATEKFSDYTFVSVTKQTTWTSSDPSVVTISSTGLLTAKGVGSATISASYQSLPKTTQLKTMTVSVQDQVLSAGGSLVILGSSVLVGVGTTSQLVAAQRLSDNSLVTVANDVAWTSSNPSVVTISSRGLLTSTGIGNATVSASYQSLSAVATVSVQPLGLTDLRVTFPSAFTAAGQTQQLTATATFKDGNTQDVSSNAQWSARDPSIIDVTAGGVASSRALGVATIWVTYGNRTSAFAMTVTPPGTFATRGRVRLPGSGGGDGFMTGDLGVPDFTITDSVTGASIQSDAAGHYNLGGLTSGTHLIFTKSDFETAEMVPAETYSEITVQRLIRITAGDTAASTIFPNDIVYDPSPSFHCASCRLIRVVNPTAGTLHVLLGWSKVQSTMTIWINGIVIGPSNTGALAGDIPVTAGEISLYIRSASGATPITLTTSIGSPAPPHPSSSRQLTSFASLRGTNIQFRVTPR